MEAISMIFSLFYLHGIVNPRFPKHLETVCNHWKDRRERVLLNFFEFRNIDDPDLSPVGILHDNQNQTLYGPKHVEYAMRSLMQFGVTDQGHLHICF